MAAVDVEVGGIPLVIDTDRLQSIEFLELLGAMEDSVAATPKAMRYALGEEQYANVKKSLRRDGVTLAADVVSFFTEALSAAGEKAKNS